MIKNDYQIGDKVEIILDYFEMYLDVHQQKERQFFGTIQDIIFNSSSETLYKIKEISNLNFYNFDLKPIE